MEPGFTPAALIACRTPSDMPSYTRNASTLLLFAASVLGVGLRRLLAPGRCELVHHDFDVAFGHQRIQNRNGILLHLRRSRLTGVAANSDIIPLGAFRYDGFRRSGAPVHRIAANVSGLFGQE